MIYIAPTSAKNQGAYDSYWLLRSFEEILLFAL